MNPLPLIADYNIINKQINLTIITNSSENKNTRPSHLPWQLGLGTLLILLELALYWQTKKQALILKNNRSIEPADIIINKNSNKFKNGNFTSLGSYSSPAGQEEIAVTITLNNDIIVDSKVESKAVSPTSKFFQNQFAQNFQSQVIGKNIADLEVTKVSGSSLTPKGFNKALEKIKQQANATNL